jgi:two-component system chemotaxis sensor kinase CheA
VHFIFQPGFSTAGKLTSVSDRGIGLDVVRKEIEGLNGSVELHYEPAVGATWTLRLPLTLSISEAILADSGGVTFAFPINFIESGLIIETSALQHEGGQSTCAVGDARIPVTSLSGLLGLSGDSQSSNGLIITAGDRRAIIARLCRRPAAACAYPRRAPENVRGPVKLFWIVVRMHTDKTLCPGSSSR